MVTCPRLDAAHRDLVMLDRALDGAGLAPTMSWLVARKVCHEADQALRSHGWVLPRSTSVDSITCAVVAAKRFHDDAARRWS